MKFELSYLKGFKDGNVLKAINDTEIVFPVLNELLKIFATTPPSVASAERNFSKLRLIKSYLRSTMNEDRLSSIAMINSKHMDVEPANIYLDIFAKKMQQKS